MGMKRLENIEVLAESEGRLQKKICDGEGMKKKKIPEEIAATARQHCQEQ